jgi:hypothetical protein
MPTVQSLRQEVLTMGATGEGKDHAEAAKTLTDRLLDDIGNIERQYTSEALEIFVADVESDIDRFNLQLFYCYRDNLPFPCLNGSNANPIPLDVTFIPELFLSGLESPRFSWWSRFSAQ